LDSGKLIIDNSALVEEQPAGVVKLQTKHLENCIEIKRSQVVLRRSKISRTRKCERENRFIEGQSKS
jgi:hypothetical protein